MKDLLFILRWVVLVAVISTCGGFLMGYWTFSVNDSSELEQEELLIRIDKAISDFVKENGAVQHHISLPRKEFQVLNDYANGTELGRSFTQYGLAYCTLPVTVNTGTEILICPKIVWE